MTTQKQTKHTPAPWKSEMWQIGETKQDCLTIIGDNNAIAFIEPILFPEEKDSEYKANALLIASAPELLEALKKTLDVVYNETFKKECSPWVKDVKIMAEKAISKAEGKQL